MLITNYKLSYNIFMNHNIFRKVKIHDFRLLEKVEFTFHKESTPVGNNNINIRGAQCSFQI